jgi:hypothetical protein
MRRRDCGDGRVTEFLENQRSNSQSLLSRPTLTNNPFINMGKKFKSRKASSNKQPTASSLTPSVQTLQHFEESTHCILDIPFYDDIAFEFKLEYQTASRHDSKESSIFGDDDKIYQEPDVSSSMICEDPDLSSLYSHYSDPPGMKFLSNRLKRFTMLLLHHLRVCLFVQMDLSISSSIHKVSSLFSKQSSQASKGHL